MPRKPLSSAIIIAAFLVSAYVIAAPFFVVHYPPITDLPFHAASMAILRRYLDPSYHFREQFSLHFIEAPYWAMHVLGALLALVLPIVWAAKAATIILLAQLPIGLSVLFYGMKKSPLLGLLGLPFTWITLTHWGFINYVSAMGLFAMVVGAALLVVDRPTSARRAGLAASLLLVFGTHIYRFPFAFAAVIGAAIVMYPATRRFRPIVLPLVPSFIAAVVWVFTRNRELSGEGMEPLRMHPERLKEIPGLFFGALTGAEEGRLAHQTCWIVLGVVAVNAVALIARRRLQIPSPRQDRFAVCAALVPLACAAVFLLMFLTLPMQIGTWWYVYPREIVTTAFVAAALIPDLPRASALRLPILAALAYGSIAQASLVVRRFQAFDAATPDFQRVTARIPKAPKLGYMVWDRDAPGFMAHPFIHMPAWVQAEKGGWLSFQFISWNAWPIRYRVGSPDVPPPTPLRFEWTPERFDLATRGRFFDWFLVRRAAGPDPRFRQDPSLRLVDHAGAWWLYRREAAAPPGSSGQ